MSNYTKTVDFAAKDTLPSGDSGKIIKGTEFETEFDNISTAIATKADSAAPTFTGTSVFTNLDINGTVQADGAVTVGVDDTGYDVKFFGATAGKSLLWDESADSLIVTGTTTLVGTANLDAVDVDGDMTFGDNNKAIFGAGSDLQIYHTGTYSLIADTSGTGPLRVVTNTFQLNNAADTQNMINAAEGGAVNLYHAGNAKLATTATGIDVTGDIVLGDTNPTITMNDSSVTNLQHLITSSSDRLIIAADNNDVSAGSKIEFYVDGTKYSEVTPTGIDVTGTVTADGLTVDGPASFDTNDAANPVVISRFGSTNESLSISINDSMTSFVSEQDEADTTRYGGFEFIGRHAGTNRTRLKIDHTTGDISFYNTAGNSQALFWDASAESLGIGVTLPTGILSISGADTTTKPQIRFMTGAATNLADAAISTTDDSGGTSLLIGSNQYYSGGSISRFTTSRSGSAINFGYTGTMKFYTGSGTAAPSEAMRIDDDGNLLVGGTSVGDSDSCAIESYGAITIARASGVGRIHMTFTNGGATVGTISTTGSATAYNTSSDQRLKDNIVDAPSASDDIDAIQVRSFDWKADGSHQKYGMVAQELLEVAPEAVSAPEDPEEMMGVDYSKLVPMMLKEIQSLRARVAQLES